jgi:PAS domain S-box-containing protein
MAIPFILFVIVRRRDLPFRHLIWLFAAFILGCGATHFMDVVVTLTPLYYLDGAVRLFTAVVSVATAIALIPARGRILLMRSPVELERIVAERTSTLRESEQRLLVTLNSIGDAVITTDREARITFMNPVACTMTEFTMEEAAGKKLTDVFNIIHETTREPAFNPCDKVLAEGVVVGLANHTVLISKSGREFVIEDSAAPIREGQEGEIKGVVLVFHDSTEKHLSQKRIKESEEKYRLIVETANEGIWMLDADARIKFVNKKMADLLGYTVEEMLGKHKWDFLPHNIRSEENEVKSAWQRRRQGNSEQLDLRFLHKSGKEIWLIVAARPIMDEQGAFMGALDMFTDVTDRRHLENELHERVRELAEANRRKDEFLAILGHELRNPLAAITNAIKLVKLGGAEVKGTGLDILTNQTEHITQLVDDIITVTRAVRGSIDMKMETVSISEVVERASQIADPSIEKRGHRLEIDRPCNGNIAVFGDKIRLIQVVANLLTNAAKYTPDGGAIKLNCAKDGRNVIINVKDNGIGIDASDIPYIFDLCVRTDRARHKENGLGVGLTMVKAVVEMHGGTVTASSDGPDKGSEFVVRLPLKEDATHAGAVS